MRIIQITNGLPYGAALTNDALNIKKILDRAGCDSLLFANSIDSKLPKGNALPLNQLGDVYNDDLIIYHPNLRAEQLTYRVSKLPGHKIMRHHVFTPAEFSSDYSADVERAVDMGNQALRDVCSKFEFMLSPSEFDVGETQKLGYWGNTAVIPYMIEAGDYFKAASAQVISRYSDGCTNVLYVSRVVPNKKQEDAIAAFAQYKRNFDPSSRLILVGKTVYKPYFEALKKYCQELGLTSGDVIFTGSVPFSDIIAYYKIADIFLFSSEHEGFGIPLIEAMLFDIPIIAYNYTAIPSTLGGCGILLGTKDHILTASWMDRLVKDRVLRKRLQQDYGHVLRQYSFEAVSDKLLTGLGAYIKSILSNLAEREYVSAMKILSRFDLATAGQIWT